MKKQQTDRAKAKRRAKAKLSGRTCPEHGEKMSTSALYWRCGCAVPAITFELNLEQWNEFNKLTEGESPTGGKLASLLRRTSSFSGK